MLRLPLFSIIILLLLPYTPTFSKTIDLDSLVETIPYDHDTVLIDQLYIKGNSLIRNNWKSAREILVYAKTLSEEKEYLAGQVRWYLLNGKHQRLKKEYQKMDAYGDSAYWFAEKHNYFYGMGEALNLKGRVSNFTGEYQKGMDAMEKALPIFEKINEKRDQMITLCNMAIMHDNLGDLPNAIDKYLRSIVIAKELSDSVSLSIIYENTGMTHRSLNNADQALEYFQKALHLRLLLGQNRLVPQVYGNIGTIFKNRNLLDSADKYFQLELTMSKEQGLEGQVSRAFNNLGSLEVRKENYHRALQYYQQSLDLKERLNVRKKSRVITILNIALCHSRLANYKKAQEINQRALVLSLEMENLSLIIETYKNMIETASESGNYKTAFQYNQLSDQYKDSLINEEKAVAIQGLEKRYQTAEKEKQIAEQDLELQRKEATVEAQRNQLIFASGGFLLLLFSGGFIFYRNRQKQKIKLERTRLEEQQRGFNAVISATEEERKRIAKDLHDGVVQQLGAISLSLSHVLPNLPTEQAVEIRKTKEMTEAAAEETRNLSHQMMPKVLIEMGLVPAMKEIAHTIAQHNIQVNFEEFNLSEHYPDSIEIAVYRIFQELINNIIKHSEATEIEVQIYQNAQNLILIVEDNGKGMINKSSDGIGMSNIKSRLSTLDGKVDYSSGDMSGTVATIVIPL